MAASLLQRLNPFHRRHRAGKPVSTLGDVTTRPTMSSVRVQFPQDNSDVTTGAGRKRRRLHGYARGKKPNSSSSNNNNRTSSSSSTTTTTTTNSKQSLHNTNNNKKTTTTSGAATSSGDGTNDNKSQPLSAAATASCDVMDKNGRQQVEWEDDQVEQEQLVDDVLQQGSSRDSTPVQPSATEKPDKRSAPFVLIAFGDRVGETVRDLMRDVQRSLTAGKAAQVTMTTSTNNNRNSSSSSGNTSSNSSSGSSSKMKPGLSSGLLNFQTKFLVHRPVSSTGRMTPRQYMESFWSAPSEAVQTMYQQRLRVK